MRNEIVFSIVISVKGKFKWPYRIRKKEIPMKKRIFPLALVLALCLSLCANAAIAPCYTTALAKLPSSPSTVPQPNAG